MAVSETVSIRHDREILKALSFVVNRLGIPANLNSPEFLKACNRRGHSDVRLVNCRCRNGGKKRVAGRP